MAAASLVFPFTYFLGDVIAEVYCYQIVRMLIWYSLIIVFLFALVSHFLVNLPSPTSFTQQSAYDVVISPLPRIFLGDFIGTPAAPRRACGGSLGYPFGTGEKGWDCVAG